jgi:hypothetical protein
MRSAVKTALFRPVFAAAAAPRAISCVERPPSVSFASTGESENMQQPIAVVAFGGNALLRRGEELTIENQRRNAQTAAKAVANLLNTDFRWATFSLSMDVRMHLHFALPQCLLFAPHNPKKKHVFSL